MAPADVDRVSSCIIYVTRSRFRGKGGAGVVSRASPSYSKSTSRRGWPARLELCDTKLVTAFTVILIRSGLCDINFLWTGHGLYYMDYKRQLAK